MFETVGREIWVRALKTESAFSKYRGIGNPGIDSGRTNVATWLYALRGK